MRYDSESGKILISCREFVSTARRGISTVMPSDSDEPELRKISKRILKKIIGDCEDERIIWGFEAGKYCFELTANVQKARICKNVKVTVRVLLS